jgi:Fur family iron response transcriptional regulator
MRLELQAGGMSADLAEDDDDDTGFNPVEDHLRAKLRAAGISPDARTVALCRQLFLSGDRHVTAAMLSREANLIGPALDPEGVEAVLLHFAERGLVREIALCGSATWYDTCTSAHYHLYDEDARQLYDLPAQMTPSLELPDLQGIEIVGVDLVVRMRRR